MFEFAQASQFFTAFGLSDLSFLAEAAGRTLLISILSISIGTVLGCIFGWLLAVSRWAGAATLGLILDTVRNYSPDANPNQSNNNTKKVMFEPCYSRKSKGYTYDTVKDNVILVIQRTYKESGILVAALDNKIDDHRLDPSDETNMVQWKQMMMNSYKCRINVNKK